MLLGRRFAHSRSAQGGTLNILKFLFSRYFWRLRLILKIRLCEEKAPHEVDQNLRKSFSRSLVSRLDHTAAHPTPSPLSVWNFGDENFTDQAGRILHKPAVPRLSRNHLLLSKQARMAFGPC